MLTQFTWYQYFLLVGATAALYYLVILLLFYRDEVKKLLLSGKNRTDLQADQPRPPQVSIMGPVSTETGPLLSDAVDVFVAQAQTAKSYPEDAVLQNVLEEVRALLVIALEGKAGKEDFLLLLRLAISKYTPFTDPFHQEAVSRLLLEESRGKFPFTLTTADLQPLLFQSKSGQ